MSKGFFKTKRAATLGGLLISLVLSYFGLPAMQFGSQENPGPLPQSPSVDFVGMGRDQ